MQSESKVIPHLNHNAKKQKLKYFLQNNYNTQPSLPSRVPISQLIRQYLNDDDFRILHEGKFVLPDQQYHKKIEGFYQQWLKNATDKNDINQFIQFWFDSEPTLDVEYSLFDEIYQERKGLDVTASFNRLSFNEADFKKVRKAEGIVHSRSIQVKPTNYSSKNQITPLQLLKQFFIFYSKKQVQPKNSSTFSKYQEYYNSIDFSKWMFYIKDIGFLQFKKVLTLQSLKSIFIRYQNKDKCMNFELFHEAVQKCLDLIYSGNKDSIENQGYKLIGIKSIQNFDQKFKSIGILPPIINKEKPKRTYFLSKSKINDSLSIASKISILTKPQQKTHELSSKTLKAKLKKQSALNLQDISNILDKNYQKNKVNTQQQQTSDMRNSLLNKMTSNQKIFKSNAKVKQNSRILQEMMKEDEGDPYLKRYNNKQTVQKYHCLMNRIDERVQKICNKY